jgi:hypothetical protein
MKYLTPELIARGQSEDHAVLNEVEATWEVRLEEYDRYLASVSHLFTAGLKQLIDGDYLHDSEVRGIGRAGDQFVMFLRSDWRMALRFR